ncbi:MAG: TetR family transcriptional regulator [Sciscionella sp.]
MVRRGSDTSRHAETEPGAGAKAAGAPARSRPYRSQTRRSVLDAAFVVFGQRGIAATSLTEVAAAAGLTKGAVYSNFASKDDLVLALMEEHAAQRIEASLAELGDARDGDRVLTAVGAVLARAMHVDATWHRLLAEYFAMAHHDQARRAGLRDRRREVRDAVVRALTVVSDELGLKLPLPVDKMAVVVLALSNGLAVEADIDPDAVPDDLLGEVLTLIAGDAMAALRSTASSSVAASHSAVHP